MSQAETTTIKKSQVDLYQGETRNDEPFGYVEGEDGGYFFTWRDSLESTLDSVEEDPIDGDGDLNVGDVVAFLRDYLPTTSRGQRMWSTADDDDDGACPACGHPADGSSGHGTCDDPCHQAH